MPVAEPPIKNEETNTAKEEEMIAVADQRSLVPETMTLEEFSAWDQGDLGTGQKFEWRNGLVEPAGNWMKAKERFIVANLTRRFSATSVYKNDAELIPETDCYLPEIDTIRIPDLAFFTREEIRAARDGDEPIPKWVIEIISPTDRAFQLETKVREYQDSGVELIWQIFPHTEEVRIYRGADQVEQLRGDGVCSAAPVVADYEISVADIFRDR